MVRASAREKGKKYEEEVVEYLKKKKYKILEKNYYLKQAEIDIIAKQDNILVFVEVKAREIKTGMSPFEAVGERKQKKILSAAKVYLTKKRITKKYIRFDVVGVYTRDDEIDRIEIIKDAFQES